MKIKFVLISLLLSINLLAGTMILMGQDEPVRPGTIPITSASDFNSRAQIGNVVTLEGRLTVVFGDPRSPLDSPQLRVTVSDDQGGRIAEIINPTGTVYQLHMKPVRLTGQVLSLSTQDAAAQLDLQDVQPTAAISAITGAQPFANLMCRFPNRADEPGVLTPTQVQQLFDTIPSNLDNYWQTMSYGAVTLAGTTTTPWFTLPKSYSSYVSAGGVPNLDLIAQDCVTQADSTVTFTDKAGINIMLNASIGCCAWGGGVDVIADGQSISTRATWNPPWAQTHDVIAHEMGHAFGMPHSTGPSHAPPSGLNVYNSAWDVMSDSGAIAYWEGYCPFYTNLYGCYSQGVVAAQLLYPDWMPSNRIATAQAGTVQSIFLTQLRQSNNGGTPLMALIPFLNDPDRYYTVEVRSNTGAYETNLPYSMPSALIHLVDTTRSGQDGQPLVVTQDRQADVNEFGRWDRGMTYQDTSRRVTVAFIESIGNAGMWVHFGLDLLPPSNDLLASATNLTTFPYNASLDVSLANNQLGDPQLNCIFPVPPSYYSLWYRHTPTLNRNVVVNTAGSNYDTAISVMYANNFTQIGCNNNGTGQAALEFLAEAGQSYYILVASPSYESYGQAQINITESATAAMPTLITPVDANVITDSTPTFQWSGVSGATGYEFYLDQVNPPQTRVNLTAQTYTPTELEGGTWYWRVRAVNGNGPGDFSPVRTLTIQSTTTAAPVRNRYSASALTLSWNAVSNAVSYDLQIATTSAFSPVVYSANAIAGLSHPVATTLPNGTYYWRVRAQFGNGTFSGWSAADIFNIASP